MLMNNNDKNKRQTEDLLKEKELERIDSEISRNKEEILKIKIERLRLEAESKLPWFRKRLFVQAIAAAIVVIPLIWFYVTEVYLPIYNRDNINLSLENATKKKALNEEKNKLKTKEEKLNLQKSELSNKDKELNDKKRKLEKKEEELNEQKKKVKELEIKEDKIKKQIINLEEERKTLLAIVKRPITIYRGSLIDYKTKLQLADDLYLSNDKKLDSKVIHNKGIAFILFSDIKLEHVLRFTFKGINEQPDTKNIPFEDNKHIKEGKNIIRVKGNYFDYILKILNVELGNFFVGQFREDKINVEVIATRRISLNED